MRRIGRAMLLACCACVLAIVLPATAVALESGEVSQDGILYRLDADAGTAKVVGLASGNENATAITIAASVGGLPVTEIGNKAFEDNKTITTVVMPDTITLIDDWAFYQCGSLAHVTLSSNLAEVGNYAFAWCALEELELPDTLAYVGWSAFSEGRFEELVIPGSLQSMQDYVFSSNDKLKKVTIGEGVTRIPPFAFQYCKDLEEIHVPASLEDWGSGARLNSNKAKIVLDAGACGFKVVDDVVFSADMATLIEYPTGKSDIVYAVPEGVTAIANYGLFEVNALRDITLPGTLRTIGSGAMARMNGLRSLTIPASVESIGRQAFTSSPEINYLKFESGETALGDEVISTGSNVVRARDVVIDAPRGSSVWNYFDGLLGKDDGIAYRLIDSSTAPVETRDIAKCDISGIPASMIYTGSAPVLDGVTVVDAGVALSSDSFDVIPMGSSDSPSWNVGAYSVAVRGKGAYHGQVNFTTVVEPAPISGATPGPLGSWRYTGAEIKPYVSLKMGDVSLYSDRDYIMEYRDNVEPGTGVVVVTGTGNYIGTIEVPFAITAGEADMRSALIVQLRKNCDIAQAAYDQALDEQRRAQEACDAAAAELAKHQVERDDTELKAALKVKEGAEEAAAEAKRVLEDAQSALNDKEAALATAEQELQDAEISLAAAEGSCSTADQAVLDAQVSLGQAQQNLDAAQAALDGKQVPENAQTALGLFTYIRDHAEGAAKTDAQCAIDILTGTSSGVEYPSYQGATRDGSGSGNDVQATVNLADPGDAASLSNFKAALDYIDEYNGLRAKENVDEGTSLATNVGMNCRMMAIAIVQLDWSRDYGRGGHSRAYRIGENIAWGYSDPFDGWYTEEKADYKNGATSGVGHYLNIVDMDVSGAAREVPTTATGFAVATSGASYGIAHGQTFYTFGNVSPANIAYSTEEFKSTWLDAYEASVSMAVEEAALADAQAALEKAQGDLAAAQQAAKDALATKEAASARKGSAQTALTAAQEDKAAQETVAADARQRNEQAELDLQSANRAYDEAYEAYSAIDPEAAEAERAAQMALEALDAANDIASTRLAALNDAKAALDHATNLKNAGISGISDAVWSGAPVCPVPVVRMTIGGTSFTLKEGVDYMLGYSGNTKAGTATVVISGMGDFSGSSAKRAFKISAANIATAATITGISSKTYSGAAIKVNPTVTAFKSALRKGTDYTVTVLNSTKKSTVAASKLKNAGTYYVRIAGKGNFTGTKDVKLVIAKASNPMVAKAVNQTVKRSLVKSANRATQKAVSIRGAQGKVTFAKAGGSKCLSVAKATGKVTVKKGTGKGTYSIKVKATAAGNANYKSSSTTVTVKVAVK